jgi:predicted metal-dependent phosphoesterase TrpH
MTGIAVDLHTHTTCSDGVLGPGELVQKASDCGIRTLAITDHDTIAGFEEGRQEAERLGMTLVSGVEVSVYFEGRELHLLGYCFDPEDEGLRRFLNYYSEQRRFRARTIVDRLHNLGIMLDFDRVAEHVRGEVVGRPHIAQALVEQGFVDSYEEAFALYLRNGAPANVQKKLPRAREALDVLHAAGGIGVLAHPGHWVNDRDVRQLKHLGLDGIETVHPSHDEMLQEFYTDLADTLSMVRTGGSDFHGMRPGDLTNIGNVGLTMDQFDAFLSRSTC